MSLGHIAQSIEAELDRVRAARPALSSRISRAENILVTHLSCRRQRTIRVRVSGGQARFLVSGSKGAVYVVDPSTWSCTCPDHHRRGAGCKHALACWALWRASARPRAGSRRCATEAKVTRHDAEGRVLRHETGFEHVGEIVGRVVAETGQAAPGRPAGSYEEQACSRCLDGQTYDGQAGSWVACEACDGSGRALLFVYPKAKEPASCSDCGERFRHRELEEVTEDHESLTWFPGDLLCPGCLRAHGGIA